VSASQKPDQRVTINRTLDKFDQLCFREVQLFGHLRKQGVVVDFVATSTGDPGRDARLLAVHHQPVAAVAASLALLEALVCQGSLDVGTIKASRTGRERRSAATLSATSTLSGRRRYGSGSNSQRGKGRNDENPSHDRPPSRCVIAAGLSFPG